MVEWMIFLLVTIATTLGAAGRATGLLSSLPRTVVDFLGNSRGYPWGCRGFSRGCRGYPRGYRGYSGNSHGYSWGWGGSTSCPSRRHSQPHGATTGHRYSRCDGRGIRPLP